jgi:hypothetical protein
VEWLEVIANADNEVRFPGGSPSGTAAKKVGGEPKIQRFKHRNFLSVPLENYPFYRSMGQKQNFIARIGSPKLIGVPPPTATQGQGSSDPLCDVHLQSGG